MSIVGNQRQWDWMLALHEKCKAILILAEEIDPNAATFIQPTVELRHALDHIFRAISESRKEGESGDARAEASLNHAASHIGRAFFDAAEWLTISLRERTMRVLGKYPADVIAKVLPEYYSVIRPRIDALTRDIAALRSQRGGDSERILQDAERYEAVIRELLDFLNKAEQSLPALASTVESSRKKRVAQSVFLTLIAALLGALVTWLLSNILQ